MEQILVLYKNKLRNKCKFYKSFFSVNSLKKCYSIFYSKLILTFVITSITGYYFVSMLDMYEINEFYKCIIFGLLSFAQVLGSSKSTNAYIKTFLSEYRISSSSFNSFFFKTMVVHGLAELIFKLAFIIPIFIISFLISIKVACSVLLGIFIGMVIQWQQNMKKLTRDDNSRFEQLISIFKFIFGLFILLSAFNIIFKVIQTVLQIIKIMVTTNAYSEGELLNKLLLSLLDSISWIHNIIKSYGMLVFCFIGILIILSILNNIVKYKRLWQGIYIQKKKVEIDQQLLYNEKAVELPFIKMLKIDKIDSSFRQLKKQPEIIVFIIIEIIILNYLDSDLHRIFFVLWFYFIGNSNYMRAMFINGNKSFSNYSDCVDLYYWRLSGKSIISLYEKKLDLLLWCSQRITIYQVAVSILLSLVFIENKFIVIPLSIFLIVINEYMHKFNAKLVSFSGFFAFSNSCKAELRNIDSDENELIEDKLHNLYKIPFTILPMILIITDYIFNFMSYEVLIIIVNIFLIFAWIIDIQIKQYLKKGGDILEEVNILD